MAVARSRTQSRPGVIVIALLAFTLIVVDRAGADAPTGAVRSVARDAFASLGNSVAWLWPFDDSAEVQRLEAANAQLTAELQAGEAARQQAELVARQRDNLLGLLSVPTYNNVDKVVAPVIAMNATNFDDTIELGKGRLAGIEVGMPVVNAQGLVGRVIRVSDTRSSVLVVTDSTSNIGVRVGDVGEIGLAVGNGTDQPMRIGLIEASSEIQPGNIVITNGMQGSVFPPGIIVGTVRESKATSSNLRRDVIMVPAVDFSRLQEVMVVKWLPS